MKPLCIDSHLCLRSHHQQILAPHHNTFVDQRITKRHFESDQHRPLLLPARSRRTSAATAVAEDDNHGDLISAPHSRLQIIGGGGVGAQSDIGWFRSDALSTQRQQQQQQWQQ